MNIEHIAVIGAGTMGNGIAQVCATTGYQVTLIDVVSEQLERALTSIHKSVEKLHSKDRLSDEQREAALTNIVTAEEVAAASAALARVRQSGDARSHQRTLGVSRGSPRRPNPRRRWAAAGSEGGRESRTALRASARPSQLSGEGARPKK